MNIRLAVIDDLQTHSQINSMGTKEGRKIAKERLPAFINSQNLLIGEVDSEIVGLLYWKQEFFGDNNWFLSQITIADNHRRKGYGETLWKYFLGYAKENTATSVFVDISTENIISLNLAQKLNAKGVGSIEINDGDTRNFYRFDLN